MTDPIRGFPFTEEEYNESDSILAGGEDEDYLSMTESAFAIVHDHIQRSVTITQRFTKMKVTEDGFGERKPQQITLIIPEDQLKLVMVMLMDNYQCLANKESDENHD